MNFTGKIKGITNDIVTNELHITLSINERGSVVAEYDKLKDCEKLSVEIKKYHKKRSLDSNAYLWSLLGEIATVLRADKWDIYLKMLKTYGKYTYIVVKPNVVDSVKKQWREVEELGEIELNGQKGVQLLCYFGSSTYDSKEFSVLLDGVISEAKELGIETLPPNEIEKMMHELAVRYGEINAQTD